MKSRSTLMLIEITVMLFVFILASALCLKAFAYADSISKETEARDNGVRIAQNAAELLEHHRGDLGEVMLRESRSLPDGYSVEITPVDSAVSGLGQAEITVIYEGKEIFSLTASWQKEVGDE